MACIALVEFMYHEFARMPGESYRSRLRSLLFDCVTSFRALIISLVCWFCCVDSAWPRSVSGLSIAFHLQNYDIKLLPSRRVYTKQLCTMSRHFMQSHNTQTSCVCSCNLPTALLAEWPGSFIATAVTRGWNGYRDKSQHRILTPEKRNVPLFLPGL